MKTADYDYILPQELIAQHPAARREQSRMLVVHRAEKRLEHRVFSDFPSFLAGGDVLVINNTRVIPARVFGRKDGSGGRIELLLLEELEPGVWDVLLRARRRPKPGARFTLGDGQASAVLLEDGEMGRARVRVESARPWIEVLEDIGAPPLPPYIRRAGQEPADRERYQTVYAREPGAVAAPTAGLHFTPEILAQIDGMGVQRAEVTLHVGLGTFRPVSVENAEDHRMEEERYTVSDAAARAIADTRQAGGRVVAVGTTVVRTLESVSDAAGRPAAGTGRTALFIRPPYAFQCVDALLTNFHLPRSTLLMLVCAFGGRDLILEAYTTAVREKYRFYSYGDCMLIL